MSSFSELAVQALFIAVVLAGEEAAQFGLLLRRRPFEGNDEVGHRSGESHSEAARASQAKSPASCEVRAVLVHVPPLCPNPSPFGELLSREISTA